MILTGRAKEDFEKWYNQRIGKQISVGHLSLYTLHKTMINSVIIEFFDSVGIYINIKSKFGNRKQCEIFMYHVKSYKSHFLWKDRQKSIENAIKCANGIYNKLKTK